MSIHTILRARFVFSFSMYVAAGMFLLLGFPFVMFAHSLPTSEDVLAITNVRPVSGTIGTRVMIFGHGFARTGNTVLFSSRNALPSLLSDGAISNLRSEDGKTISFILPATITATVAPLCPKESVSCAAPTHELTAGTYIFSVVMHHSIAKIQKDRDMVSDTISGNSIMVMGEHDDRMMSNWLPFNVDQTSHTTVSARKESAITFTQNLRFQSRGQAVRDLQYVLKSDTTLYPEAIVSGYFGRATESAVARFQKKYNISESGDSLASPYGFVGPATNAMLRTLSYSLRNSS